MKRGTIAHVIAIAIVYMHACMHRHVIETLSLSLSLLLTHSNAYNADVMPKPIKHESCNAEVVEEGSTLPKNARREEMTDDSIVVVGGQAATIAVVVVVVVPSSSTPHSGEEEEADDMFDESMSFFFFFN